MTKRLVAHRPADDAEAYPYGPRDGEPVDLPAPCARLRAGYWCSCGASFIGTATWESTHFARIVPLGEQPPPQYVDDRESGYEAPVPWPTPDDRAALQAQIEALPLGTVVERFGVGVATRFADPREVLPWAGGEVVPF